MASHHSVTDHFLLNSRPCHVIFLTYYIKQSGENGNENMEAVQQALPKSKNYSKLPPADGGSTSVIEGRKCGCNLQPHPINE